MHHLQPVVGTSPIRRRPHPPAAPMHHTNIATTERYLGINAEVSRRNRRLRGKPFLTTLRSTENVVDLRAAS